MQADSSEAKKSQGPLTLALDKGGEILPVSQAIDALAKYEIALRDALKDCEHWRERATAAERKRDELLTELSERRTQSDTRVKVLEKRLDTAARVIAGTLVIERSARSPDPEFTMLDWIPAPP